jgi:hypothetical protein
MTLGALLAAALASSQPATAQMIPVADLRQLEAGASFLGVVDEHSASPLSFFGPFNETLHAEALNPDPEGGGLASADAFQFSQFFPAGIYFSGGTGGQVQVHPGTYHALSDARFRVRLNGCITYDLYIQVDPGDDVGTPTGWVEVKSQGLTFISITAGETTMVGRLPAGDYEFRGYSGFQTSIESLTGATYSMIWTCAPCAGSLISDQPDDTTITCSGPVSFSVTASQPVGTTYQWRRNMVPLANGGNISGANTPMLTIDPACDADTAFYDVVLTNGGTVEPSRLARLSRPATSGVDPTMLAGMLTLDAPTPNPARFATSFRYAAERPVHTVAAIYDLSGRMVRQIANQVLAGSGVLTWDGDTASGAVASPGIYFLRVEAAGQAWQRRVVRIR